jgi:hypothetical protein
MQMAMGTKTRYGVRESSIAATRGDSLSSEIPAAIPGGTQIMRYLSKKDKFFSTAIMSTF